MLLNENSIKLEKSENFVETEFKIKNSSIAFDILSKKLYSDPQSSIIRELSCNAYDSHIAAGKKDVPFDIHLPTNWEPEFSIRDYGIGLSLEEIKTIYTTYFESTKRDSNDYIGCLGLGSKTPFAIVDKFNVSSFYDGKKYTYFIFLNENRIPSVALVNEEATDEPNGLLVQIPIPAVGSFGTWATKAHAILRWFKVQPKITGQKVDLTYPITPIPGKNWVQGTDKEAYDQYNGSYGKSSYVLMGNVAYPINSTTLAAKCKAEDREVYTKIISSGIVLLCDIGDVSVTASREDISYDKMTVETLLEKLEAIRIELSAEYKKIIDECECRWDAIAKYRTIAQKKSNSYLCPRTFRGKDITDNWIELYKSPVVANVSSPSLQTCMYSLGYSRKAGTEILRRHENAASISVEEGIKFVVCDTNKPVGQFARGYLKDAGTPEGSKLFVILCNDKTEIKQFFDEIDFPLSRVGKLSSLPIIKQTRSKNGNASYNIYKYNPATFHKFSQQNVDFSKGGYYVKINDYCVTIDKRSVSASTISSIIELLKLVEPTFSSDIYGVIPSKTERFEKSSLWTEFSTYVSQQIDAKLKNKVVYLGDEYNQRTKNLFDAISNLGHLDNDIKNFIDGFSKIKSKENKILVSTWTYFPDLIKSDASMEQLTTKILKKYPLLDVAVNAYTPANQKMKDHLKIYLEAAK